MRELAKGRDVLDCFCYTGGFTVNALAGGAKSVVAVDASADALALGRENVRLNGGQAESVEWCEGDVFQVLRKFRDEGRSFDLIVLDPPKFAPTAAQAREGLARLQRYQPAGVQTVAGGWNSGHVFVLGRDRCGPVPKNCRLRRFGCGRGGARLWSTCPRRGIIRWP